jgi:hypothetical protein
MTFLLSIDERRYWTIATGQYAEPIAEHEQLKISYTKRWHCWDKVEFSCPKIAIYYSS